MASQTDFAEYLGHSVETPVVLSYRNFKSSYLDSSQIKATLDQPKIGIYRVKLISDFNTCQNKHNTLQGKIKTKSKPNNRIFTNPSFNEEIFDIKRCEQNVAHN